MRLLVLLLLVSCATGNIGLDPTRNYQYNMRMKVDGKVYEGVAVLPEKPYGMYEFFVETVGSLDLFSLVTCSKYLSQEKAWGELHASSGNTAWNSALKSKSNTSFHYTRTALERRLSICQLYLEGLEKDRGRHSQALVDFQDSKHKLPAYLECSLRTEKVGGVSICQNKAGNYASLAFDTKTRCLNSCNDYDEVKLVHDLKMPSGICIWVCSSNNQQHRLTTYGFDERALIK
jgi:hypothetical protein